MYDLLPFIFSTAFLCIGSFMALMPKLSVKKEHKNSEEEIKKVKKNGIIIIVITLAYLILTIFIKNMRV